MSNPEWYEPYTIDKDISVKDNLITISKYLTDTYGEDTVASHVGKLLEDLSEDL